MALHQRHLTKQLVGGDSSVAAELHQVSSLIAKLMQEQAVASGRATASLWLARRHLWLAQSSFSTEDRNVLFKLPVVPLTMFGPDAKTLLEEAQEARKCAKELSGKSRTRRGHGRGPMAPRVVTPRQVLTGQEDLRAQLDAVRRSKAGRGQHSGRGRGRGPRTAPSRS